MMGLTPVGAGPRFLCLTGFDFTIILLYTEGEPGGSANYAPGSDRNSSPMGARIMADWKTTTTPPAVDRRASPAQAAPPCGNGMQGGLSLAVEKPPLGAPTWLIEADRRRGAIGLHLGAGRPGPGQVTAAVWLEPDEAETVACALLQAVASWRAERELPLFPGRA